MHPDLLDGISEPDLVELMDSDLVDDSENLFPDDEYDHDYSPYDDRWDDNGVPQWSAWRN